MYDVLCYGAISLDISGRVDRPWHGGGHASATDYRLSPGGDAALVALTLAGLGLKVALAGGPVGRDPPGHYIEIVCAEAGVDLCPRGPGKTSLTAVAVTPSGERSSITYHEDTPLEQIPVPVDLVPRSRLPVRVRRLRPEQRGPGRRRARTAACRRVLNLDTPALDAIGLFDTVIASADMASQLAADPLAAAELLRTKGAGLGIVTLGADGCISSNAGLLTVPAYPGRGGRHHRRRRRLRRRLHLREAEGLQRAGQPAHRLRGRRVQMSGPGQLPAFFRERAL